ncbi:MAG: hypothetical protein RIC15_05845 [Vicingaceae bacterium]
MKLPPVKKKQEELKPGEKIQFEGDKRLIYLTVALFFTGNFLCAFFGFRTMISIFEFIRLIATVVLISIGIQFAAKQSAFPLKRGEKLTFAVFGLAPMLGGLFLVLNFTIPVRSEFSRHKIDMAYRKGGSVYFKTATLPCSDYPELCVQFIEDSRPLNKGDSIVVRIDKGVGGFKVLKEVLLIEPHSSKME